MNEEKIFIEYRRIQECKSFNLNYVEGLIAAELGRSIIKMLIKFGLKEEDILFYDERLFNLRNPSEKRCSGRGISYESVSKEDCLYSFEYEGKYYELWDYWNEPYYRVPVPANCGQLQPVIGQIEPHYKYLQAEYRKSKSQRRFTIEKGENTFGTVQENILETGNREKENKSYVPDDFEKWVVNDIGRSIIKMLIKFGLKEEDILFYDDKLARIRSHAKKGDYYCGISYRKIPLYKENNSFEYEGEYYELWGYFNEPLDEDPDAINCTPIQTMMCHLKQHYDYLEAENLKPKSKWRFTISPKNK